MTEPTIGVLDTRTLILIDRVDGTELPDEPVITAVTLAELSVGPLVAPDDAERAARQAHLQLTEASFDPLAFDAAAARAFGQGTAALRTFGRKPTACAFDLLIAATAIANDLPVYTCNPAGSAGVDGLTVMPVTRPAYPKDR